jgi:hypothetical protein
VAFAIIVVVWQLDCQAQEAKDSIQSDAPNIFVDYPRGDYDYFRTEITFVNFVRDRKQADVHILVTSQQTGSGGEEYTIEFIGRRSFDGMNDTLTCVSMESDTEDNIRSRVVQVMKQGLVWFAARTPVAKNLTIVYDRPAEEQVEAVDKWNYWVFEISGNGWFNGQKTSKSMSLWANFEARRVTKASRIEFDLHGNYSEDRYEYGDYKSFGLSRSKGASAEYILSLDDHWSAGIWNSVRSSTYGNKDIHVQAMPAIEFNVYPYDQSTRRQLRFTYGLGANYINYTDTTIYYKTHEWLYSQLLRVELVLIQPWGSISATLSGSNYLHDFHKNRLYLYNQLSIRLFEGFSFNINGNVSRIHDQLALAKGDATEEEVLKGRKELATSYSYWASVGISYSFGSIYNNIVNPRFGN